MKKYMIAVALMLACSTVHAATKSTPQPAPAPNVTTVTTACEPIDSPFPVPVPKVPITVVLPGMDYFKAFLRRSFSVDSQTAPSC